MVATRSQAVYETIKRRIIQLEMPPGSPFTEGEIAEELGFSKTPVREALSRLRLEGLVDATARSGYTVTPITLKDARDLFALRELLEGETYALAAEHHPGDEELGALVEPGRTPYDPKDPGSISRFLRANTAFHVGLARLGGNERMTTVLSQVHEQLERLLHLGLALTDRVDDILHEHSELLDAVRSGDPERAREAAHNQARASKLMVLEAFLETDAVLMTNIAQPLRHAAHVAKAVAPQHEAPSQQGSGRV